MPADATRREATEIVSLTALRGVLACWVVVYHYWNDVLALFPAADALSPAARWGHMAVPAFFMLSGFVLAYTYTDKLRTLSGRRAVGFLGRRLARIYPVHLVTLLAVAAMVWVSRRAGFQLTDAGYSGRDFVLNLLLVHTWVPDFSLNWNYPSWSISSEWFAYLMFPLVVAAAARTGLTDQRRAAVLLLLAAAGSVAVGLFWRPWPFYELVLVVPTFLAGVALCWALRDRPPASGAVARWSSPALVGVMAAGCFAPSAAATIAVLMCASIGLIGVLAWTRGACLRVWRVWPVVFLGEVSYSLYMTHTLAQKVAYKLLPSSGFVEASFPTRVGVLAAYAALVAVFCLATYYAVEKPCRNWFRRPPGDGPAGRGEVSGTGVGGASCVS